MSEHAPNCRQCEHFQVTWDNNTPLACKKFGFKTKQQPSVEVLAISGRQCTYFELKEGLLRFQRPVVLPDPCTFSITG